MAEVTITGDALDIKIALLDRLLSFHGSFRIPLEHVTNAYVSSFEDLQLQYKLEGTNFGMFAAAGVFGTPTGMTFVDVADARDRLVIETRAERFPRIAV